MCGNRYISQCFTMGSCWLIFGTFCSSLVACALTDDTDLDAEGEKIEGLCDHDYGEYWPSILNTFSTFLLVFVSLQQVRHQV